MKTEEAAILLRQTVGGMSIKLEPDSMKQGAKILEAIGFLENNSKAFENSQGHAKNPSVSTPSKTGQ